MESLTRMWTVFWKSGLFLALWAVLLAPLIVPFATKLTAAADNYAVPATLYFELVGMLTILAAAWFMVRFIDRRPFLTLGWRTTHLLRDGLRRKRKKEPVEEVGSCFSCQASRHHPTQ